MKVKDCKLIDSVVEEVGNNIIGTAKLLKEKRVRNIIVLENHKPVGIVSSVDIVNEVIAEEKDPKKIKVEDIMTKEIFFCDAEDDVAKVYFEMVKRNIFVCPVVENGKLIGGLPMHTAVETLKCKPENG